MCEVKLALDITVAGHVCCVNHVHGSSAFVTRGEGAVRGAEMNMWAEWQQMQWRPTESHTHTSHCPFGFNIHTAQSAPRTPYQRPKLSLRDRTLFQQKLLGIALPKGAWYCY